MKISRKNALTFCGTAGSKKFQYSIGCCATLSHSSRYERDFLEAGFVALKTAGAVYVAQSVAMLAPVIAESALSAMAVRGCVDQNGSSAQPIA